VRGFLFGFVLLVGVTISILSMRRGGLRSQLRFAARRLRLALALGGVYLIGATIIRIFFAQGPVADFGPAALAVVLLAAFLVFGQDPAEPPVRSEPKSQSRP
jgi:hypothetical protein